MSVELINLTRIKAEQAARIERRRNLQEAFADISHLVVNTGTHMKAEAAATIAANLVNPNIRLDSDRVIVQPSKKEEPTSLWARNVSRFKAKTAREEYIEEKMKDDDFFFAQLANVVFYGADINAFMEDPETGLVVPSHKEARKFPVTLPEKEFVRIREKLYRHYVNPPSGRVRVIWDISESTINGLDHDFIDLVEVIADPLDAELVDLYLNQAVTDGKILNSNTHLAAFEMLCESHKIRTVSRLPHELSKKGYKFADFRQSPKPEELLAIRRSINNNQPVYVA